MTPTADETLWANARPLDAEPLISIVVPFKDYDVLPLTRELVSQASAHPREVELLFADDGSGNPVHSEQLRTCFGDAPLSCRLLICAHNRGRSVIRNRLADIARGRYLLYLDADMLPDEDTFLERYLKLATEGTLDIACGGRSYRQVIDCPAPQRLYRYFSMATECVGADVRNRHPLWYLLTNNLLVRRSLLLEHPFDQAYHGWGFEDADWALRLHDVGAIHIDNTASHMGLPDESQLLAKYDDSAGNFRHIYREVPEFRRFALFRVSRLLAWVPLPTSWLRRMARGLVLKRWLPMHLRYLGVHGYRAATYAGVLRADARAAATPLRE